MSKNIILVIGGAKSGKTAFALRLGEKEGRGRGYIATATALDEEMKEKITLHKKEREGAWETIEEPVDIDSSIQSIEDSYRVVLIDCITLWLNNLIFHKDYTDEWLYSKVEDLISSSLNSPCKVIMVTNELGMGIVPDNQISRKFRDIAGKTNQIIASAAEEVYLVTAGIGIKIK